MTYRDIGDPIISDYPCDQCKTIIKDATIPMCCNGNGFGLGGCGCMGMPTEPVFCSDKCTEIWYAEQKKQYEEALKNAQRGIK